MTLPALPFLQGRARHSIRRRPPSRRHRQSNSGEEVSNASEGGSLHSKKEKEEGEDQNEGKPDKEEDQTDGSTIHTQSKTQQAEREELKHSTREEDEEIKNGSPEGGEDKISSETKVEEEKEDLERRDDVTEKATNPNSEEVERMKSEVILQTSISPSVFVNTERL